MGTDTEFFHADRLRRYLHCCDCQLVFAEAVSLPTVEEEKQLYDQHQNSPQDEGYRRFLGRLYQPLRTRLTTGQQGLDFGSGPGPTLSVMFEEIGCPMSIYDPIYAPDSQVWQRDYDFITASEVVEHLHQPNVGLERIWARLKPGGFFGIMTKMVQDKTAFVCWHYKNDPTHVCFYSAATFDWLANKWQASVEIIGTDVIIFHKHRH
ncbi:MAG: class I SAM-dependent methyltransferase [Desulfuromonas sp.]|nr:class I SAM-dependent methyltransferase [Desulfuromonas sp.]